VGSGLFLEVHPDGLKEVHTFAFPKQAVCLAISPDGRWLAASSWPGDVSLWDLEKRRLKEQVSEARLDFWIKGAFFMGDVNNQWLAFSPDSKTLAYATRFGRVHLWSIAASQDVLVLEAAPLAESQSKYARLFFNKDGSKLFALSQDNVTVNRARWDVWNAAPLPEDELYAWLAGRHIGELAKKVGLKEEIQALLEADPRLKAPMRKAARVQLATFVEDPIALNNLASEMTAKAGLPAKEYRLALRQVQRAVELAPFNTYNVHTLGEAYYRVGEYQKALETFRKAIALRPEKDRQEGLWDLHFLAMLHHQLGESEQARAYLKRLREMPKGSNSEEQALYRHFLAEAGELIEGKK
jgi:tetratricopeptide (TPR) repeat protein